MAEIVEAKRKYYCICADCENEIPIIDDGLPVYCYTCGIEFMVDWSKMDEGEYD